MGKFSRPITEFDNQLLDPYWEDVVLYTRCEADPPVDLSNSGHTITDGSGFSLDTSGQKFGSGAADLAGNTTNDYLSIADSDDFNFGAGPFTMECWHRWTANTNVTGILSQWDHSSNQRSILWWYDSTNDRLVVQVSDNGTAEIAASVEATGSFVPTLNQWYHLALTRDENNIWRLFVDGTLTASKKLTQTLHDSTATFRVGTSDSGQVLGNGRFDEVRVTKGVCRYYEDFTPQKAQFATSAPAFSDYADPYWDHVVFQTDFETKDVPVDQSVGTKHALTLGSGASISSTSKFGSGSVDLDDTSNAYVSAGDDLDWYFGDLNFTLECWAYWNVAPSSDNEDLLSQFDSTAQRAWKLTWNNSAAGLRFAYSSNGTTQTDADGASWTPTIDTWYHIAVCRNGADLRIFIDGVQSGSTHNISTTSLFNSTAEFRIGVSASDTSTDSMDGYIDSVRITKGVARYISDFAPPTRTFPVLGCDEYYHALTCAVHLNEAPGNYRNFIEGDENNIPGAAADSGISANVTLSPFNDVCADSDSSANGRIIVGDPYWDSVVLLTHMDHTTPVDVSLGAHTLTVNSATRDTTDKKFGASSFSFSTTNSISAADSADWDFGSGDFTVECWVYFDSAPSGTDDPIFLSQWDDTGSDRAWMFNIWNGNLRFINSADGSTAADTVEAPWSPSGTTWYHVAACRVNGYIILYIDGAEVERAVSTTTHHASAATFRIGHPHDVGGENQFQRNIDDVRITKGVGRYSGSFTPPTRPHSSAVGINTSGEFTIEGWVRFETDPGATGDKHFLGQWNESEDERGWLLQLQDNNLRWSYSTDGTSGTVTNTDKTWNPAADDWYHIAITRDASDDMRWFVDGVQVGSTSNITATWHDSSAVITLGRVEDGAIGTDNQAYYFDWRITNGVAKYTSDFVAPIALFSSGPFDVRNLGLNGNVWAWYDASADGGLWSDDNADVVQLFDLSGNNRHMINATASERPTVLASTDGNAIGGRRTIDFDGSSHILKYDIPDNNLDGEDLPMTFAIVTHLSSLPATDTNERLISFHTLGSGSSTMQFGPSDTSGTPEWKITRNDEPDSGAVNVTDTSSIGTTNPHVAIVVFHGTTVDLWIDGVQEVNGTAMNVGIHQIAQLSLGARNFQDTEGNWVDCRVGEFFVLDYAIGDKDAQIVSNYLMTKWGLI